ncbi:MAG: hypothetical protein M1837_003531 [Sclerophora amabilis]|nr:MAG: hypothetical protein M1837_003531 [Sclerophora amabilis]
MDPENPSIPMDPLMDFANYHHARVASLSRSDAASSASALPSLQATSSPIPSAPRTTEQTRAGTRTSYHSQHYRAWSAPIDTLRSPTTAVTLPLTRRPSSPSLPSLATPVPIGDFPIENDTSRSLLDNDGGSASKTTSYSTLQGEEKAESVASDAPDTSPSIPFPPWDERTNSLHLYEVSGRGIIDLPGLSTTSTITLESSNVSTPSDSEHSSISLVDDPRHSYFPSSPTFSYSSNESFDEPDIFVGHSRNSSTSSLTVTPTASWHQAQHLQEPQQQELYQQEQHEQERHDQERHEQEQYQQGQHEYQYRQHRHEQQPTGTHPYNASAMTLQRLLELPQHQQQHHQYSPGLASEIDQLRKCIYCISHILFPLGSGDELGTQPHGAVYPRLPAHRIENVTMVAEEVIWVLGQVRASLEERIGVADEMTPFLPTLRSLTEIAEMQAAINLLEEKAA